MSVYMAEVREDTVTEERESPWCSPGIRLVHRRLVKVTIDFIGTEDSLGAFLAVAKARVHLGQAVELHEGAAS